MVHIALDGQESPEDVEVATSIFNTVTIKATAAEVAQQKKIRRELDFTELKPLMLATTANRTRTHWGHTHVHRPLEMN
jgi:hypothetical protein